MYKKLIIGTIGIYIAYLSHSILSQKLYNGYEYPKSSGTGSDLFIYPSLVFMLACLVCSIYGLIKSIITKEAQNPISLQQQVGLGLLYSLNYLTAHYCLLFISYPTQAIGRNLRYLSVILVGVFLSRVPKQTSTNVSIGKHKLVIGAIITFGVGLFNVMKFMNQQEDEKEQGEQWKGYVLLAVSVVCDAFFNDSQAYTKVAYRPTSNHLYTCTNLFGFIFALIFSIFRGILFRQIRDSLTINLIYFNSQLTLELLGQNCIYYIISNFKQHLFPLIATTRKLMTILISIWLYNHQINFYQWIAVFLVFGSLIYEVRQQASQSGKTKPYLTSTKQAEKGQKSAQKDKKSQ